jgi:hypothetical protein
MNVHEQSEAEELIEVIGFFFVFLLGHIWGHDWGNGLLFGNFHWLGVWFVLIGILEKIIEVH